LTNRKISASLLYMLMIVSALLLSIVTLYGAYNAYTENRIDEANYLAMTGIIGISMAVLMLNQIRRAPKLTLKPYHVVTMESCQNCDFKNVRDFRKGDYVFQNVGKCPKCGGDLLIVSIYREEREKREEGIF